MVAIFTGPGTGSAGAGLDRGSGAVLGSSGLVGSSGVGQDGSQVFLNAYNGNLVIQRQDEFLVGLGPDASVARTYNSLGDLSDDNGDNWRQSTDRQIYGLVGAINSLNSTVQRLSADGSDIKYTWNGSWQNTDGTTGAYVTTDGSGAYDTLTYSSSTTKWTWTDGDTGIREVYQRYVGTGISDATSKYHITTETDTDNNSVTFSYNAFNQLDKVTTKDGSSTETGYLQYGWSDTSSTAQVTSIVTGYRDIPTATDKTLTRTLYTYESYPVGAVTKTRLLNVTVDLSPEDNSIADGKVYTTSYGYETGSARVTSISQSDGSRIDIAYDPTSHKVTSLTTTPATGVSRTSTVTYGAGFTKVTDPLGQVVQLDYDGSGQLTKITMPQVGTSSQITQFSYDSSGNVTSVTDAAGGTTTFSDFINGNWQTRTDPLGNVTTRVYSTAANQSPDHPYQPNLLLTESTAGLDETSNGTTSHTTHYIYDAEGHLCYTVSAGGDVTQYTWSGSGLNLYATGYPGNKYTGTLATNQYDALAQMNAFVAGLGDLSGVELRQTVYDARGNVIQDRHFSVATSTGTGTTSDGTTYTYYTYNQAGQLITRNVGTDNTESFIYDGLGRITSSVDVNGGTTSFVFGEPGAGASGNATTTVTFADGLVQTSTYDHAGELVSFAQAGTPGGMANTITGASHYTYDNDGRLRSSTDATNANTTYYFYDNVGRKVADVSGAGEMVEYRYDADNRLVATINYYTKLASTQLTGLHDATSPPDLAAYRPAGITYDIWNWNVYDADGRLTQTIAGDGSTSVMTYDGEGKLTQTTDYYNKLNMSTYKTVVPTPIPAGLLPTASASLDAVSRNFYDKDGRLIGAVDAEGGVTQSIYDNAGRKTDDIAFASATTAAIATASFDAILAGVPASTNDRHTRYVYNGQNQLRYLVDSTLHVTEYKFDNSANGTTVIAYANALTDTNFSYAHMEGTSVPALASANDRASYSVFDTAGRIAYSIDGVGDVVGYTYNTAGQVIKTVQFATTRSTTALPSKSTMDSWSASTSVANNADNRVTRNYYDNAGVLRYVVDGEGFVSGRTEDADGRLTVSERFPNSAFTDSHITVSDSTTASDVDGWVKAYGGTSAKTTNTYDSQNRLLTSTDGEGSVTRYVYNPNGTLAQVIAAYGTADASSTKYAYDTAGRMTQEQRAYGIPAEVAITYYTYDGQGNVLTITDPNGHVTTQAFDQLGHLLKSTDALGGVTSYAYNAFGEVVSTTDPNLNTSYTYYNPLGQVEWTRDALGYVTHTLYTPFCEIDSVTRYYNPMAASQSVTIPPSLTNPVTVTVDAARDAKTSFTYDHLGRLTDTTDAEGYTEHYGLNAFGDRISVTNKLGGVTTNAYDRRGLLKSETLPMPSVRNDGTVEATSVTNTFKYDARGNRIQMVEASGLTEQRTTNYQYDQDDRLIAQSGDAVTTVGFGDFTSGNPGTAVVFNTTTNVIPTESYIYDARGNLIETIVGNGYMDASGAKTFFYYDHINRKTAEVDALGTLTAWTYDDAGNVMSETVYGDAVALPATPGGAPPSPVNTANYRTTGYSYDVLNRLHTTTVGATSTGSDVLTGTWDSINGGVATSQQTISTSLTYDANGNVITSTDANGGMIDSWYDKLGRKTDQLDQAGYLTHWTYDDEGNVLSETRYATKFTGTANPLGAAPTVASDAANDRATTFTYDRNGNRKTETRAGVAAWSVDPSHGQLTQQFKADGVTPADSVVTYTYNGLREVTSKTQASLDHVSYTYDQTGRLLTESQAAYLDQTGTSVTPTVTYSYDGLNDLTRTQQGGATLNGATDRITKYVYGAGGRVASMTDASGAIHNYDYDAEGNQVRDYYTRIKSDGTTSVTDGILYRRDLLGRVVGQTIATSNGSGSWTRGDAQNTHYDAYGEVDQQGVNGLWQQQYFYNSRGLVEKSNSGDGVWRFHVYDKNGNEVLTIQSEGKDYSATTTTVAQAIADVGSYGTAYTAGVDATISVYDARNQVIEVKQPKRETTAVGSSLTDLISSQTYNAFGETASQTDALNNTTTFVYNTMGRLIQKVMPLVSVTSATGVVSNVNPTENYYYDLSGRAVAKQDADGNVISQSLLAGTGYDGSAVEVTAEYHPDGIAKTGYDVFGDARTLTDELSRVETRTYDGMGRVATIVRRTGLQEAFTYDLLGQQTKHQLKNASGTVLATDTTDYDLEGRVSQTVNAAGDITTNAYVWDPTISTALGTTGGWTETTTQWQQLGSTAWKRSTETTDVHGLTTTSTDLGNNVTNYIYDRGGRLTQKVGTAGGITTTLAYTNYNTDLIAGVVDSSTGSNFNSITSSFAYDAMGRRTHEKYSGTVYKSLSDTSYGTFVGSTQTLQDATTTYDALGRVTSLINKTAAGATDLTLTQAYDAAGNVRETKTVYPNLVSGGSSTTDYWFTYDSMNRMVIVDGAFDAASQTIQTVDVNDARILGYDAAGNRTTATEQVHFVFYFNGNPVVVPDQITNNLETYNYDGDNQVSSVTYTDGSSQQTTTVSTTTRDILGRVTDYKEYQGSILASHRYNIVYNARGQASSETDVQYQYGGNTLTSSITNTYDSYGNLTNQTSANSGASSKTTWQIWAYQWHDAAVVIGSTFDNDYYSTSNYNYSSNQYYDGLGRLQRATIADGKPRAVSYAVNSDGEVVTSVQNDGTSNDPIDVHRYVSTVQMAEYSSDNKSKLQNYDYADLVASKMSTTSGSTRFYQGQAAVSGGEFGSSGYDPINDITAGTDQNSRSTYVVQDGDTLQSIAGQVWGDSSLWYLIADANGLSAQASLSAGQTLALPLKGPSNSNNASMYRPYDNGDAVGNLNPTSAKPPKHNKCAAFGQVLLVAIAVAVTAIATAGATAAISGQAFGSILGAMTGASGAVTGVSAGAWIAGGAIGGAIGSAVSQGVGVVSGLQDQFSWKQVGMAAIAGGVGGGISAIGNSAGLATAMGRSLNSFQKFMTSGGILQTAAKAAASSALTEEIGVATGLEHKFDWAGVAAAAVGAVAGSRVGAPVGVGKFGQRLYTSVASDISNAATRSVLNGSDFGDNLLAALPDVIGQTIGGIIADGVSGRTTGAPTAGSSDGVGAQPTSGDEIIVTADRVHTPNPITDPIDFSDIDAEWAGLAGFGARITDPAAAAYAAARKAEIVQQLYENDVSRAAGGAPAATPSRDDIAGTKPPIPVDVRVSLELPQIDSWAQGLDAFWAKNSQTYSVESYNADKAQIAGWRSYVAGLDAQAEAQVNREIGGFILAGVAGGATGALLAPVLGGGLLGSSVTAGFSSANAGVPLRWSTGQENSVTTYGTDWLLGAGGNVAFRGAAVGLNRLAGDGWVSDIGIGTRVTRVFGEDSGLYGRSWTTDPYSTLSRNSLGLETTNSAEFYAHGVVIDNAGITTRAATPWGRFAGGGQETLIPNSARQVRLLGVTMPDQRMPWTLPSDPKLLP